MILRGTTLSDKRQTLDAERTERSLAPVRVVAPQPIQNQPQPPAMSAPEPAAPPAPPPLTLDRVAAWLAQGDDDRRSAVAAILATDISSIREAAAAEGFAAGSTRGLQEAQARSQSQVRVLQALAAEAEKAFSAQCEQLGELCADIVADAFVKIAGEALVTREAVIGSVTQVLRRVKEAREITIRVSSADLACLGEAHKEIADALSGQKFSLVADPRVEAGGCIVESQLGSLDGRLEVQLRALCETLRLAKSGLKELS